MRFLPLRPAWQRKLPWLACAWFALGAQAATVDMPVDLLQSPGGLVAPAPGPLERALTIDTNSSQRNLDLLLEARRAGEAAGPMGSRGLPTRQVLPGAQARDTLVPLGLQSQDSVTAPGAAERREWQAGAPGRSQAGLPGGHPGLSNADQDPAHPSRPRGEGAQGSSRVAEVLSDLRGFVRDNRFELLGGAVLLMLAAAGVQALARRRT